MSFISYAQNFEDVMLWRALGHIPNGCYLDIGAQDPVEFSVSLAFYERGWRGMHAEPNAHFAEKLREARPEETVLEVALGEVSGVVEFFDIKDTGLSTLQATIAEQHRANGFEVQSRMVPLLPLDDVLESFSEKELHWLKIDVEGAERRVLEGWRKSLVSPWVVVVESTLPLSQEESHEAWEPLLLAKGYRFAYFDGLNRFYVTERHPELLEAFSHPPCVFDDFALVGSHSFCRLAMTKVMELEDRVRILGSENERQLAKEAHEAKRLRDEAAQLRDEAAQLRDEAAQLRKRLTQLQESVENLRHENERFKEVRTECEHWRGVAELHRTQFEALIQSRSWRFTRPFRGLCRLLRGEYRLTERAIHGVSRGVKSLLRPLLLVAMKGLMSRPDLWRWGGKHLKRWPTLHRRLLALAWHSGLLDDSSLTTAQPVGERPEALSPRAQQIYERLQEIRKRPR